MGSFFRNKHVIIAMFVAPLLAVLSWYVVDDIVAEKPHSARSGQSYPLMAMSNCRYKSGQCTLKNGDIKLTLQASKRDNGATRYVMTSTLPVQGAMITLSRAEESPHPVTMVPVDGEIPGWRADLAPVTADDAILRLAVNIDDSIYFAETGILFVDYETVFSQDNFSQ